jgi:hypothetical protein
MMPIFMLTNGILCVCMLLTSRLCFNITMFMREREIKWKHHPWSYFSYKRVSYLLLCCFYLLLLNLEITKTLVTHFALFWFRKLASYWCLTTTTVSWGRKAICLLLQVARRVKKRNHLSLPWEFDINLKSSLWEKYSCCITLRLESQWVAL